MDKKSLEQFSVKEISSKLLKIQSFLNKKYVELEDYIHGVIIALISRSNMIALGPPGTAKSAVIRDLVKIIDFSDADSTPYFWFQLGEDIHPNNVFGLSLIHI